MAVGLFCLYGATLGGEWFLNHRKAKRMAEAITPNGARLVYGLIGVLGIGFGIMLMLGFIKA